MSATHAPDRFTSLPNDETLAATVVALEDLERTGAIDYYRKDRSSGLDLDASENDESPRSAGAFFRSG